MDQFQDFQKALGDGWESFFIMLSPKWQIPENAIFFRKELGKMENCGGYWLSETPHIPGSVSWDSECIRFANYIILNTKEGRFRLLNTHIDHKSQLAQLKQSEMLNEDADVWQSEMPQIMTGDFNCGFSNPAIQSLLSFWRDSYAEATGICEERFTAHEFMGENLDPDHPLRKCGKIDWIFIQGKISCSFSRIIMDHQNTTDPSDHYFVVADVTLKQ